MCKKSKRKNVKNVKQQVIYSPLCKTCMFECKDAPSCNNGKCVNYKEAMTLDDIKSYTDNNFIEYVVIKNDLNKSLMKAMLAEKIPMKFSYYVAITNQIYEKDEYLSYIEKFEREGLDG